MLSQPQVSYLKTPFARHVHLGSFEPFIMEGVQSLQYLYWPKVVRTSPFLVYFH